MRYLSLVCLLFSIAIFSSCKRNILKGSGSTTTVNPAVASFNGVNIDDLPLKVDIEVQQGAQPGIQMSGYENVLNHIKTKVEDNILVVYTDLDEMWTIDGDGITVKITVPSLAMLTLSGAPDAGIHGNVTGSALHVDVSGASNIVIDNIATDTFAIEVSGAADLHINGGSVKYADYQISGAGKVKAYSLQSIETSATISGAGTCEVNASQKLAAHVNGAGTIRYKGHPAVTQDVSGVGSVKDAN